MITTCLLQVQTPACFQGRKKRGGQKMLTTTVPHFKKEKAFAEILSFIILLVSLAILICKRDQESKELDSRGWIKSNTMHCPGLCSCCPILNKRAIIEKGGGNRFDVDNSSCLPQYVIKSLLSRNFGKYNFTFYV